jgi:hypothetical protein
VKKGGTDPMEVKLILGTITFDWKLKLGVSSVSTHSSAITCTSHMTKSGVKIV